MGSEDDPARGIPSDPPITAQLAQCVDGVEGANAAFPRGRGFPAQVDRAGFRADWDALDDATRTLERSIASERLLAIGVAAKAESTASDARNRLDTLDIAVQGGQPSPVSRQRGRGLRLAEGPRSAVGAIALTGGSIARRGRPIHSPRDPRPRSRSRMRMCEWTCVSSATACPATS